MPSEETIIVSRALHRYEESNEAEDPDLPEEDASQEPVFFAHVAVVERWSRSPTNTYTDASQVKFPQPIHVNTASILIVVIVP